MTWKLDKKWWPWLIAALAFCLYLPALQYDFVQWDDYAYVVTQTRIRSFSWQNILDIWNPYVTARDPFPEFLPLRDLSFVVDYFFWGLNPAGYHFVNILFHALNSALCFFVFKRWSSSSIVALVVAVFFACHPIHVESVAWVSSRKDVLGFFWMFLSLLFFLESKTVFSVLCFVISIFCKVQPVVLPAVLLLVMWQKKLSYKRLLPHFLIAALYCFVFIFLQFNHTAMDKHYAQGFEPNPLAIIRTFVLYLRLSVAPIDLSPYYAWNAELKQWSVWSLGAIAVSLGYLLVCLKEAPKRSVTFSFLAAYFIMLSPVLNFLPHPVWVANRYAYFAAPFLYAFAGILFETFWRRFSRLTTVVFSTCVLACIIVLQTHLPTWTNTISLWSRVVYLFPQEWRAYQTIGQVLLEDGKLEESKPYFLKYLQQNPKDIQSNLSLAIIDIKQNELTQAYQKLAALIPRFPQETSVYFNLAEVSFKLNKEDEGFTHLENCLKVSPMDTPCLSRLGHWLAVTGKDIQRAETLLRQSIEIDTRFVAAYYDLGVLLAKTGRGAEAQSIFEKILDIEPNHTAAKQALTILSGHP